MISHTTESFRKMFAELPSDIQKQAKAAYGRFQKDPFHPSLRFKRFILHDRYNTKKVKLINSKNSLKDARRPSYERPLTHPIGNSGLHRNGGLFGSFTALSGLCSRPQAAEG